MAKVVLILSKYFPENYIKACEGVGIVAEFASGKVDFSKFSGLILPGGDDIDPKFYGENNISSHDVDEEFDEIVFEAIKHFEKANKPIMGICLGAQYINVYFGGALYQNINNHKNINHIVKIDDEFFCKMFGGVAVVNSRHHQAIKEVGKGLFVFAQSEDGIIEGITNPSHTIFGLQWHPERMGERGLVVFEYFKTLL